MELPFAACAADRAGGDEMTTSRALRGLAAVACLAGLGGIARTAPIDFSAILADPIRPDADKARDVLLFSSVLRVRD